MKFRSRKHFAQHANVEENTIFLFSSPRQQLRCLLSSSGEMIKLFDIECDAAMQNNNDDESFEARGTETRINVPPHAHIGTIYQFLFDEKNGTTNETKIIDFNPINYGEFCVRGKSQCPNMRCASSPHTATHNS